MENNLSWYLYYF